MRTLYFVSVLFLLLAQACDKVKDTPEPDYFQAFDPQDIQISMQTNEREVWVNILDYNKFKAEYRIEIGEPVHGKLIAGVAPGGYLYQADSGYYGADSVTYRVCLGTLCKQGVIHFYLSPPHCHIEANADSFKLTLTDVLNLPVLNNDSLNCSGAQLKSVEYSGPGSATVENGSIHLALPEYYEGNLNFSYTIGNEVVNSTATVSVKVSINDAYCLSRFQPVNDTLDIVNPLNFRTFVPSDLYYNDSRCSSILNINSFKIPNPPNNSSFELVYQSNRWWFLVKDTSNFTQGSFEYEVCTNTGDCRKARAVIRKP